MTFVEFLNIIHTHAIVVGALCGLAVAILAVMLVVSRFTIKNLHKQCKTLALQSKLGEANVLGNLAVFYHAQVESLAGNPFALEKAKLLKEAIAHVTALVTELGFDQTYFDRLAQQAAMTGIKVPIMVATLNGNFLRDITARLEGIIKFLSSEQRVAKPSAQPTSMFAIAGASPTQPQDADVSFDNLLIIEAIPNGQVVEAAPTSSKRGGKIVKVDDDLDNAKTTVFKVEEDKELPTTPANPKPPSVPPVTGSHNGLAGKSPRLMAEGRAYSIIGNNSVDTNPGTPDAKLRSSAPPPKGQTVARVSSPPPAPTRTRGPVPPTAPPPAPQRTKVGSGTRTAVQVPQVPTQVGVGNRVG